MLYSSASKGKGWAGGEVGVGEGAGRTEARKDNKETLFKMTLRNLMPGPCRADGDQYTSNI
jgi:hypothetical protein